MQSSTTEPREIHNAGWVCANNHGPYATRQEAESCQYCKPDIDRLADTALAQAHTFAQNEQRIAAVRELATLARETEHFRNQADVMFGQKVTAEADRDRFEVELAERTLERGTWQERAERLARRVAELEAALREICAAEWKQVPGETPFQFEQRLHRIAAAALAGDGGGA